MHGVTWANENRVVLDNFGRCYCRKGCVSEIRVVNAYGSGMRVLAKPNTDCEFDFSPTWSPDGQTILFSHESCSYPSELYTVPAAGGSPHDPRRRGPPRVGAIPNREHQ